MLLRPEMDRGHAEMFCNTQPGPGVLRLITKLEDELNGPLPDARGISQGYKTEIGTGSIA